MKTKWITLVALLLWGQVVLAQDYGPIITPQPTPDITHVIVISIDGARPDGILQADTPILQQLATGGAVDWQAQTVSLSVTVPAHASLLTGLSIDEHGITHNDYSTIRLESPTFISLAQAAGYKTAIVAGKEKFIQFHQDEDTYYEFVRTGDPGVADKAIELLEDGYEVLFVHLPNTDFFGHLIGWMSDTYIYELGNTDDQIGRIINTLDELNIRETTLIIITADHGGHDQGHGQGTPEDMTIPMILNGPGILPYSVLDNASITQVAATVFEALDLQLMVNMDVSFWEMLQPQGR